MLTSAGPGCFPGHVTTRSRGPGLAWPGIGGIMNATGLVGQADDGVEARGHEHVVQ